MTQQILILFNSTEVEVLVDYFVKSYDSAHINTI